MAAQQETPLRPDGAIRLKRVYEPAAADDGLRLLVTRLWPRGVRRGAVDEWIKDLGTPRDMLSAYQKGQLTYEDFAVRYRAWLDSAPEAQAALDRVAGLAVERDIALLTSLADLTRSHVRVLRQAVVAKALDRLGDDMLQRTRRFQAVLFHSPVMTVAAGQPEHADDLLAMVQTLLSSGRELDLRDVEQAEDRSPQCYMGSYSVFGTSEMYNGSAVGAIVAESAQIGRFSAAEADGVRDLGRRAARLLAAG